MDAIKVLVVENNAALREGWAQLINGTVGFLCVGDFAHAKDIASLIRRTKPQVVLMDMDFPHDRDGMEALLLIKAAAPDIHVIIQTYCADTITIFQAIKAGASGYLLKTTKPCRLLEAIQDVLMGGSPMTPSIAYKVLEIIRENDRTVLFTPPLSIQAHRTPKRDSSSYRRRKKLQKNSRRIVYFTQYGQISCETYF